MKLGIECQEVLKKRLPVWGRLAYLGNQASVAFGFVPGWKILQDLAGSQLTTLLGPQHGFEATVQDNMIETGHAVHRPSGLPVYSLYSETRTPSPKMLEQVDTIVIDLQIVGCRVYTFKYTIAGCLRAAAAQGKHVVVLDRLNPLGGSVIGGRVLDRDATSFVGEFPIPMRHGLTPGEAARLFNKKIGASLEVVSLQDWQPSSYWADNERPWLITSPNLPSFDSVVVYPGTVMLEGTNISEGRGTGLPFQFVGAPYLPGAMAFTECVRSYYGDEGGLYLRPSHFQPTSQKWAGEECRGLQIHVLDPARVRSYELGLAIIRAAIDLAPDKFQWKDPPYEYDHVTLPIKLILGNHLSAEKFKASNFSLLDPFWYEGLESYAAQVKEVLLYERNLIFEQTLTR